MSPARYQAAIFFAVVISRRLLARLLSHVGDANTSAFARKKDRRLAPDSPSRARDDRDLSVQSSRHFATYASVEMNTFLTSE